MGAAADFAVQCSARPKPTGLVEEIRHLRRQPAKPGAGTDDDRVIGSEVLDLRDRGGLVELVVRLARDLLGHQLGHALDINMRAGPPRPLRDSILVVEEDVKPVDMPLDSRRSRGRPVGYCQ